MNYDVDSCTTAPKYFNADTAQARVTAAHSGEESWHRIVMPWCFSTKLIVTLIVMTRRGCRCIDDSDAFFLLSML